MQLVWCVRTAAPAGAQEAVPWQALQYISGEIVYGGRVTDNNDRTLLLHLVRQYFSPAVLQPRGVPTAVPEQGSAWCKWWWQLLHKAYSVLISMASSVSSELCKQVASD